jgi:hypothetical protein
MAVINLAQWPRMSQLLDELLEVDHSRRAEHLAEIGGHDPEIAAQLARLLARNS